MLRAWQDMESCRNYEEEKINPIIFNNKDFLMKGKIIFNTELYNLNICQLDHIFDKDQIRPIHNFMSLGLNSKNITCVWAICDAVVTSGNYDGTSVNWYSVDTNDYNISI